MLTAFAGINVEEHSSSVVTRSLAWEINRVSGVYGSLVMDLSLLSRVII